MAEDEKSAQSPPVEGLTEEETLILKNVLSRLEWRLFQSVVSQLKTMVIVAAGILTLFGIASFTTLRSAAIDAAANKLATNSEVREEVVAEATRKLEKVNAVLQKSSDLDQRLDAEQARAMRMVGEDLDRLLSMVLQLEGEIAKERRSLDAKP